MITESSHADNHLNPLHLQHLNQLKKPPLHLLQNHRNQSMRHRRLWTLPYLLLLEKMIEQRDKKEKLNNKRRLKGTMQNWLDTLLMSSIGKIRGNLLSKEELNNKKGTKITLIYRFILILTIVQRTKQTIKNLSSAWTCLTLKPCFWELSSWFWSL